MSTGGSTPLSTGGSRPLTKRSRARTTPTARIMESGGSKTLRRVSDIPIGVCSLAAQTSPANRERMMKSDRVTVLVDCATPADVEALVKAEGGTAQVLAPATIKVAMPRTALGRLATLSSIRYVEASLRLKPHCDLAHASARLMNAQGARTVPQRGAGVLIGVIDTGIDTTHPAFMNGSKTRIVDYFDQTIGTAGRSYTQTEIQNGTAAADSPDTIGHGTHVAGICAGNGGGSTTPDYAGVAPDADIAIVKTTFDSADIASAVARIFALADQSKKPCVVNLSLGGHIGGHDGTTVTERTIDQLCDQPGRVVVVSAGNEGDARLHAGTTMPRQQANPARWVADLELAPRAVEGQLMGLLWVQVWTLREDDVRVTLRSPNGELFEPQLGSPSEIDRGKFAVSISREIAPYSGDSSYTFGVFTVPEPKWLKGWSVIVEEDRAAPARGITVGSVHAWIASDEMGRFNNGFARSNLVGMPGTAFSAITVASYATRKQWQSQDPATPNVVLTAVNLEDISYFSSPGPNRDSLNKPEIAAPGQWVISALSAQANEEEMPPWLRLPGIPYCALQGTSMAAPYVTGAVALLLEKKRDLHWAEIKRRLIKTAAQDAFTFPCWNERWGFGKLDLERLLTVEPA